MHARRTQYICLALTAFALIALVVAIYRGSEHRRREYVLAARLAACGSFPIASVQTVRDTSRVFVNIPKDIYPGVPTTDPHGATAGYISNGGLPGQASGAEGKPDCASYYYELDGTGTVDISAVSGVRGMPEYRVRFRVNI